MADTGFWGSVVQTLLGLGGAVLSSKVGKREVSGEERAALSELAATNRQQRQFATASVTPDDPMFRNLSGLLEEKSKRDLAHSLNELMKASRRERSRGYGPLINPERRDEARSQAISRGFVDAGISARDEARRGLLGASGAVGAAQPGLAQQINILANRSSEEAQNRAGTAAGLFDLLNAFRGNVLPTEREDLSNQVQRSVISRNLGSRYGGNNQRGGFDYFGGPR